MDCAESATVLFVIQLSLGESIWSPRWYDYSMSVAPEGREGVFTAMASAPLFLGKFVTGNVPETQAIVPFIIYSFLPFLVSI